LADGIDPAVAKREEKQEQADAAANTVEAVARIWLTKTDEHIFRDLRQLWQCHPQPYWKKQFINWNDRSP